MRGRTRPVTQLKSGKISLPPITCVLVLRRKWFASLSRLVLLTREALGGASPQFRHEDCVLPTRSVLLAFFSLQVHFYTSVSRRRTHECVASASLSIIVANCLG